MTDTPEKRKLGELRVVDLKVELEKRGKDGNGVKNVLLERLTQTLRDAGEDPEVMEFEILVGKTSLKKGKANSGGKPDEETNVVDATVDRNTDATDVAIKLEETVDSLDGEVTAETNKDLEKDIQNEQDTDTVQPCPALAEENDKETVVDKQPNKQQTSETINTPKLIADGNSNKPVDIKEESKEADNEDSLNLTIGEEDEKLLHDSNMDVEQKEQASRKPKEQPVDNSKENPSEETKKNDDKREGKLEKNIIPSSSEKDAAAARTTASSVMSTRAGGEKGTSVSPTSTATVTAAVAVDSDEKTKEGVDSGNSTAANVGRNLWVSRLSSLTRATDLKQIFSKYGKVIGAKVVTNSRTPGTRCYGYVTMASTKDATECISHLHRTELHGRLISVERAKSELGPARQSTVGTDSSTPKTPISNNKGAAGIKGDLKSKALSSEDKKKNGDVSAFAVATVDKERSASQKDRKPRPNRPIMEGKRQQPPSTDSRPRPGTEGEKPYHQPRVSNIRKSTEAVGGYRRSRGRSRSSRERRSTTQGSSTQHRERDRTRQRSRDSGRGGTSDYSRDSKEVLSLQKIREERERHRVRERERQLREEERRRREVRARQREEEERLQREREKLAAERERIEKEKAELLRIVRERQKLEREKIELEHLELKQQQRKIEEAKRSLKRPSSDRYEDDRKRSAPDRRVEAPPPPRFDSSISSSTGRSNYDRISSSEKKSRLDDYSSTSKRDDFRRDSFKRGSDDYRRGGDDYKRGGDDYKRDSRDDYKSSGRSGDDYGKRDSGYSKRDIDRPMSSSYDSRGAGGSGGSGLLSQSMSKDNRYNDRSNDYRGGAGGGSGAGLNGSSGGGSRGGADDRDRNNSSGNRYGNDRASGGGGLTSGGNWHNNSGMPQLGGMSSLGNWGDKSNDSASGGGGWRNMDNGQDRYDRTYNERKPMQMSSGAGGGFMDQPRTNQFMGGNGGGRPQDRYSQSMSNRFDNGRY